MALDIEKHLISNDWQGASSEYTDLISHAQAASEYQPENIIYRHWLNVYRLRSVASLSDPLLGVLVVPDNSIPAAAGIVKELYKALAYCPTFGATYCVIGQIEKFILKDPAGSKNIQKGFLLAPSDPTTCFVAGCLDIEQGNFDQSLEKFTKAAQLDDALFMNVMDIYINKIGRPDLAVALAGENTAWLNRAVDVLENSQYDEITDLTMEKLKQLLEKKCSRPDASANALVFLANFYKAQHNNQTAVKYYRRALAADYGQVYCRYLLATLLAEMGSVSEAMREARICLRLNSDFKEARELIADLSIHPAILVEKNRNDIVSKNQNF